MADRYWVGGSGTWNATATANWSTSSGGAGGASAPTSVDSVFFNANSNIGTGAFTVTVTAATCLNFTASGLDGLMTIESAATNTPLDVYGSLTIPATNFVWSPSLGITLTFRGTASNTIVTNGVTLNTTNIILDAVGGELTLGSAITVNSTRFINVINGSFSTSASNYSISAGQILSNQSTVRSILLNASAVSLTGATVVNFTTATNLTFNAGTSTITCSGTSAIFTGGAQTFHNVIFSNAAGGTTTINGENTFNNLTQASRSNTGSKTVIFTSNQTINGTLTLGAANTSIRRIFVFSTTSSGTGVGTPITLTTANIATLSDVDFRDITAAGAAGTWSGTRLGNGGGNTNITFDVGVNKYWNLAAGGSWQSTAWALTSGGAVAANNFPLAQDTVIFDDIGLTAGSSITLDNSWWVGTIDASTRTTAFTLAFGTQTPYIFGSVNLPSVAAVTGTGTWYFGASNSIQTITTNGVSFSVPLNFNGSPNNIVRLLDNTTVANAVSLQQGTLDLNNNTLSLSGQFSSTNTVFRTLAFGESGKIVLTGTSQSVFTTAIATNLTVTGTNPLIQLTTAATTGSRGVTMGAAGEANAISVDVMAGSDSVAFGTTNGSYKNINFTGFTGNYGASNSILVFGDWNFGGVTSVTGLAGVTFASTSGTKTITSNGVTYPGNVAVSGLGGTFVLQDALTLDPTRTLTFTSGTLDLNGYTVTAGLFSSSNSNVRELAFGTSKIVLTATTGTVLSMSTATNFTYTGTSRIEITASGTGRTLVPPAIGAVESNVLNIYVTTGSDTILISGAARVLNFDLTGFTGTLSTASSVRFFGDLVFSSGMTVGTLASTFVFAKTSGTQNITSAGKTIDANITVDAPGATIQLQDALTSGSTRTFTLDNGTVDLNGYDLTIGIFSSSISTTRTLDFGSAKMVVTGTDTTVYNTGTATGLTLTGTRTVEFIGAGIAGETRSINGGQTTVGGSAANAANIYIKAGADIITLGTANRVYKTLDFTGFSGTTFGSTAPQIYGDLVLSPTMTVAGGTNAWGFLATTAQSITTNGVTITNPIIFDGVGGTWTMQDALTLSSTRALIITNGSLTSNGYAVTAGSFSSNNSNARAFDFSGSTVTIVGTGTSWDITDSTNMTLDASNSSLVFASNTAAIDFQGGGKIYNNITYSGNQDFTVYGNNTFNTILDATKLNFESGSTQSLYSLNLTNCTLNSTVSGVQFNLYNMTGKDIKVTSCTIKDSAAAPVGYWYAPISSGNVNAGNNTGWDFGKAELMSEFMNFLVS
jgi:hypothetical protein